MIISPPTAVLNDFDKAVIQIFAPMDTRLKPQKFKQLLSDYPDVVHKLQKPTGGQLRPNRSRRL
ncbi:MAG: hypothetical protein HRU34_19825 [Richelia sp.]|nr:hypothetical protein [Richelia sp.]